jgi:cytochrome c5
MQVADWLDSGRANAQLGSPAAAPHQSFQKPDQWRGFKCFFCQQKRVRLKPLGTQQSDWLPHAQRENDLTSIEQKTVKTGKQAMPAWTEHLHQRSEAGVNPCGHEQISVTAGALTQSHIVQHARAHRVLLPTQPCLKET